MLEPGNAAALLVYENTWAGPFVSAMRRAGAEVVASMRLPADAVIARLEELEAAESGASNASTTTGSDSSGDGSASTPSTPSTPSTASASANE